MKTNTARAAKHFATLRSLAASARKVWGYYATREVWQVEMLAESKAKQITHHAQFADEDKDHAVLCLDAQRLYWQSVRHVADMVREQGWPLNGEEVWHGVVSR